jgi:hypothetical protein
MYVPPRPVNKKIFDCSKPKRNPFCILLWLYYSIILFNGYPAKIFSSFFLVSVFGILFIFIWILVGQLFIRQGVQATAKTTGTGSVGDGGKGWQGSLASLKASTNFANWVAKF